MLNASNRDRNVVYVRPLLQEAIKKVARLPPADQDAVAAAMIEELADQRRWAAKFRRDHKKLAKLADEALAGMRAGRAKPMRLGRAK